MKNENKHITEINKSIMQTNLTELISQLTQKFIASQLNEECFMHIMNQTTILSTDESSLTTVAITFKDYATTSIDSEASVNAASILAAEAHNILLKQIIKALESFEDSNYSSSQDDCLSQIKGYCYPEQLCYLANIVLTDTTIYITITEYPQ